MNANVRLKIYLNVIDNTKVPYFPIKTFLVLCEGSFYMREYNSGFV